jgi:hypothetical protein
MLALKFPESCGPSSAAAGTGKVEARLQRATIAPSATPFGA